MAILGLATSGADGRIGLQLAGMPIRVGRSLGRSSRGRDLLPEIQRLLAEAAWGLDALTAIVVDRGPGSFTGVRVGVTCAKSLAFALEIPVAGVLSLDLLAHAASIPGPVTAIRDAGRDTLYVAAYGTQAEGRPVRSAPARLVAASLGDLQDTTWVGEDAVALCGRHGLAPARDVTPTMASLFALGAAALESPTPAHALAPYYLQASAPERLKRGEV